MRLVIQRAKNAKVTVEGNVTGEIENGYVVFLGVADSDTKEIADKMAKKLIGLRIFEDENGKTNLSIKDVDGELLIISQFTLYADCRKGNRPSFNLAGKPDMASDMYDYFCDICEPEVKKVGRGVFGADMKVELTNDGPFTIWLDSDDMSRNG